MSERRPAHRLLAVSTSVVVLLALGLTSCRSTSSTDSQATANDQSAPGQTDVTIAAEGPPRSGGTLRYGLEAESDGYLPWKNRFAISGTIVGLAIYDPLTAYDENLEAKPYLAESLTPNADFTSWKIKVRGGVTFHDGTPLTGEAVKADLDAFRSDTLLGTAAAAIADIQTDPADPLSLTITMKTPWATFPASLTGQAGMIAAPSTLADASQPPRPVGTGPFVFSEWVPDQKLTASRNAHYWRKDSNGQQLPYLDGVEFRPLPDAQARTATLVSGGIDMLHTNVPDQIISLRDAASKGAIQLVEDRGEAEEGFVMLNLAKPPFDNKTAREAVAYATDRATYSKTVNRDVLAPATNVFTTNSRYYVETPFPTYDPDKARQLVEKYRQDTGQPLAFTLGVGGADSMSRLQSELLQAQYNAVGMQVDIKPEAQSTFIANTALGNYQANIWRQFGSPDPDYDYIWWISDNAKPVGSLSLNFARLKDPELDAALRAGRATNDPQARKQAYTTLQQRLNDDLAYIWLNHSLWVLAASNSVRGITNGPLPDGSPALPVGGPGGFGGVTSFTQTWLSA